MKHGQRQQIEYRIRIVFEKAEQTVDDELRSEIAKYLCILASGFLEAACRDIVGRFIVPRADPQVCRFISATLDQFQNPDNERILQLVGKFGQEKRGKFEQLISREMVDAVTSIVANRHQLAHGRNVGVSLAQIRQYYSKAREFVGCIEQGFST